MTDTLETLVGAKVDKYEIKRVVGRGGMGMVYEALNTTINKRVAMKFIDAELAENEEASARFQREALAASAIESPHIVQIFDAGATTGGVPYIVMELLRGEDLGKRIVDCGKLDVAEAVYVTAQVLKGLHHAHEAGIVHRDLKPDNVFLVERDDEPYQAKLLDFGVSKIAGNTQVPLQTLTRQGAVVGTPYYMSPEQAQGHGDIDGRTDIYAVGAILFECLTGRPPHLGQTYEQVIVNICMKDADDVRLLNPDVPEPLAQVIARALSREREARYGTSREMLEAMMSAVPDALRSSFLSSGLQQLAGRMSTGSRPGADGRPGATTTPAISITPLDGSAGSLADTVADPQRIQSGVTTISLQPPPKRRGWLLLVGAAAFVLGVGGVIVFWSGSGEPAKDGSTASRGAASAVAADLGKGAAPTGKTAEPTPTASTSASVVATDTGAEPATSAPSATATTEKTNGTSTRPGVKTGAKTVAGTKGKPTVAKPATSTDQPPKTTPVAKPKASATGKDGWGLSTD